MLFYRDETLDDLDACCPICKGELKRSFFWPMLHDVMASINFVVVAIAVGVLAFFAVYQLMLRLGVEIPIPPQIGRINGKQLVVLIFLVIGAIVSHFMLKMHISLDYFAKGFSLEGSRHCQKCDNRFLILLPVAKDPEDSVQIDLPRKGT